MRPLVAGIFRTLQRFWQARRKTSHFLVQNLCKERSPNPANRPRSNFSFGMEIVRRATLRVSLSLGSLAVATFSAEPANKKPPNSQLSNYDHHQKIALVTGASKGIGFEICRQLAKLGFTVLLGSHETSRGTEAAKRLQDEGLDVHPVQVDMDDATPSEGSMI